MEVFHYVADQLKEIPLFEATTAAAASAGIGAIFNDFDNPSPFDESSTSNLSFSSQSTELNSTVDLIVEEGVSLPEVDCAILESDRIEGLWNEDLTFEKELFDYGSEAANEEYYRKVYLLLTESLAIVENISEKAERDFEIRCRNNWQLRDSVYDAWLIQNEKQREFFSKERLKNQFPDLEENQQKKRKRTSSQISSDDDLLRTIIKGKKTKRSELISSSSEEDSYESLSMLTQNRMGKAPHTESEEIIETKPKTTSLLRFRITIDVDDRIVSLITSDDETQTDDGTEDNKDDVLYVRNRILKKKLFCPRMRTDFKNIMFWFIPTNRKK